MKTSKSYSDLSRYYFRPELEGCLDCGAPLKRSHTVWHKVIASLKGTAEVYNQGYRCQDRESCGHPKRVYRSVYADGLSLPYYTYGLDVIVYIGQQRLRETQSIPAIHRALREGEIAVQISEREVQNLFDVYLSLSACSQGFRLARYRPQIEANGGLILGIDGAKPEKGQPGLYIFRDALTGCRLHAALLYSADAESLALELRQVAALGLPIQAVISDDERATQAAVAEVLPDIPHGLCHLHFLKAVQKPVRQADSQLASRLKQPLRAVTSLERQVANDPETTADLSAKQHIAIGRYLDAFRAVLLTKAQAPFRLAGVPIYEALSQISASLQRAQTTQPAAVVAQLLILSQSYQPHQATYEEIKWQQDWFLGLAELLDVSEGPTYGWPTQTGPEVAQAVADYLDDLDLLRDEFPFAAPFFDHIQARTQHWAPGLFWTYEVADLPRTNNDLETDIGDIKEQYRRITGRRTLKDYLMRYGPYLTYDDQNDDPQELLLWFQEVDRASFVTEKAKLDLLRERLRNIHRFRRDPLTFLTETERLWLDPD
jgi:hypothetical protein